VLGQPGKLRSFKNIQQSFASSIIKLECLRTIDRGRVRLELSESRVAQQRSDVFELLEAFHLVPLDPAVLDRAEQPFPTLLRSLDAIQLSSAMLLREEVPDLWIATHDEELALAAKAVGFDVRGVT